ncbi:Klp59C [Symbiodinium sp. KB8]|nr:Klp59C [Symbiodinium sp. KB8]
MPVLAEYDLQLRTRWYAPHSTGEDIRKRDLPGLDPWTAQWLASIAKEMMITSFKVNEDQLCATAWKDPNNGVKYFKSFLRFYLSVQRMQEAGNDFHKKNKQTSQPRRRWTKPTTGSEISMCGSATGVDFIMAIGHGGRQTFLVIEEGYLDTREGYSVEDTEDGAEDFLVADDDTFWVYDDDIYTWFQRRFQGRKMRRGFKGRRKGKRKGGKGSGGRRFFKNRKGKSSLADAQTDAWQADGQWHDSQ